MSMTESERARGRTPFRFRKQGPVGSFINKKLLVVTVYLIYLLMLVLSRAPNMAEDVLDSQLENTISYYISFKDDGWSEHYYVERYNQSLYGIIEVIYTRSSNTLEVTVSNIKELTIDCRSMFEEKSEEVFGVSYAENSNYYKWYFIDKNLLNVNIDSDKKILNLTFIDTPLPYEVRVNGEKWLEDTDYFFKQDYGLVISNVPEGHSNVDIYFRSPDSKIPVAKITTARNPVYCNELVTISGEESYDPDNQVLQFFWDLGDGTFIAGKNVISHRYETEGVFGLILTLRDEDQLISHAYLNLTVLNRSAFSLTGVIPDQIRLEDSGAWELDLTIYEPPADKSETSFRWFATGENGQLYVLSGENSTGNTLIFTPVDNAFGNDKIRLWLTENGDIRLYQDIWVNITPVNDPPLIIDAPDIVVQYDVDYTFNYEPYITDVDNQISELVLSTSDDAHASTNALKVTYNYPKEFVDKDDNYVILTISDGENTSQKVIRVKVIDGFIPELIKSLPDIDLYEGETRYHILNLKEHFSPVDETSSVKLLGLVHVTVLIHENFSMTAKAPHDWTGTEFLTVRITAVSGAIIEDTMGITVQPINDPPQILEIPDLIIFYDQDYSFNLRPYIFDEDDPIDSLTVNVGNKNNIRISKNKPLVIILNYPWKEVLPYTVKEELTVSDGRDTTSRVINIIVSSNHPPALIKAIPDFTFYEDTIYNDAFNIFNHFIDVDGDNINYLFSTTTISVDLADSGDVSLSAPENWFGLDTVYLTASDDASLSAFLQTEFRVYVIPVNDPPEIKEIPQVQLNLSETARLDLTEYISDIDNDLYDLHLSLNESSFDAELFGFDLVIFGNEPRSGKFDIGVSDNEDSTSQIVIVSIKDNTVEPLDFGPILWIITAAFIIFITTGALLAVRRYYGKYEIVESFLMYENGCLIKHMDKESSPRDATEVDLVGSMFTAVQDFIEDSFSNGQEKNGDWSLRKMEFGGNNILIERGKNVFLAVIFTGTAGTRLINSVKNIINNIETNYGYILEDWDGDLSKFDELHYDLK